MNLFFSKIPITITITFILNHFSNSRLPHTQHLQATYGISTHIIWERFQQYLQILQILTFLPPEITEIIILVVPFKTPMCTLIVKDLHNACLCVEGWGGVWDRRVCFHTQIICSSLVDRTKRKLIFWIAIQSIDYNLYKHEYYSRPTRFFVRQPARKWKQKKFGPSF